VLCTMLRDEDRTLLKHEFHLRQFPLIPREVRVASWQLSVEVLGAGICPEIVARQLLPNRLIIVDLGRVEFSDVRTDNYSEFDVGLPRSYSAARRIRSIFPIDVVVSDRPLPADLVVVGPDYQGSLEELQRLHYNGAVIYCAKDEEGLKTVVNRTNDGTATPSMSFNAHGRGELFGSLCVLRATQFLVDHRYGERRVLICDEGRALGDEYRPSAISATVALVGVGGTGSNIAQIFARDFPGIRLRLIDGDSVSLHNLNRQIYTLRNVGNPKVECLGRQLRRINRSLEQELLAEWLTEDNAIELLKGCDMVLDCVEAHSVKHVINRASICLGIHAVYGGTAGWYGFLLPFSPHRTPCFQEVFPYGAEPPGCSQEGVLFTNVIITSYLQTKLGVGLLGGKVDPSLRYLHFTEGTVIASRIQLSPSQLCPMCHDGHQPSRMEAARLEGR